MAMNRNQEEDIYKNAVNAVRSQVTQQPTSRANQTINRITDMTKQTPFQFQSSQPFSYDQNSDPAYQAALASARSNIQQGQADTNARLRAGGQGKSSYSESVANQISAKEMGRVSTDVLPQLISQAYQRYADQSNRDLQTQQLNYGVQQDQISQLARLYDIQNQQDFQNPMSEAQLTGRYLSGEAREYIDAINNLKRQAETAGITREERSALSQQADAYRSSLQGLGVDPSMFGADVSYQNAVRNMAQAGSQTLPAQQFAQQIKQSNLDAALAVGQATGRMVSPQEDYSGLYRQAANVSTPLNLYGQQDQRAAQQQQFSQTFANRQFESDEAQRAFSNSQANRMFEEDKRQFGLEYDLRDKASNINSDANWRAWAEMGYNMFDAPNAQEKYSGMTPTQVMSSIRDNYVEFVQPTDLEGKALFDANPVRQMTSDPNRRYQMFLDVVFANLPSDIAENQVLTGLGFSREEINQMEKRAASDPRLGN